tara:strand:- start:110 stop:310 length:201 start_codon:yes stop_codon:yes gene_type:complete
MARVVLNCCPLITNAQYAPTAGPAPGPKPKLAVASYADGELEDKLIQPMVIVGFVRLKTSKAELVT